MNPSYTSEPVWLAPSRERQLHDEVIVAPGREVRLPYAIRPGWRCVSYRTHLLQDAPGASYHVQPLQANFSFAHHDAEGSHQHHASHQGISGPSTSFPALGIEADMNVGHQTDHAQGAQRYTMNSTQTTHDALVLVASVPKEYKKKKLLGYKTKPVTTALKVQLEVFLERLNTSSPSLPAPAPASLSEPEVFQDAPSVRPSKPLMPPVKTPPPDVPASVRPTSFKISSSTPTAPMAPAYTPAKLEALLQRKLKAPDVILDDAESIALLTYCVSLGEENTQRLIGKQAVIVIGNTGAGKSTFVNHLLGCEMMKKSPRELGMKGVGKVVVVRSAAEGGPLDEIMPIGHTKISKTFVPQVQEDLTHAELVYCDCPGFLDNRGAEVNIANAVNIRRLLQSSSDVRVIVLINYHSLKADRGRGLRETLEICTQLFGSSAQLVRHRGSLLLGITQVPSDEADLEGLREWLLEDSPAVMSSLCEQLFLYDPIDDRSGDYLSRASFVATLRDLQVIPRRDAGKLFHTVLTDSDEKTLLKVVEKQGKQLREHLRSEHYGAASAVWRNLNRLRVIDHISVERMLNDDSLKIQRMLARRVAKFRDDSVHYRFASAKQQLSALQEMARHFSTEDLSLLELDVEDLASHLAHFEWKKAHEDQREEVLRKLTNRLDAIAQQRALLEEHLASQAQVASQEQSRLRAEMVRRDADHEAQVTKLREEQAEFLRKQAEVSELQQTESEEERMRQLKEREQLRQDYEARLRAAEAERKAVRAEYEKMLQEQETSRKASEASVRDKLSKLAKDQQATQDARRRVLPSEAVGAKAWKEYFGVTEDAEPKLPDNIEEILNAKAPFLLEDETSHRPVRENHLLTLIPGSVDGVPFTLDKLGAMLLENRRGHFGAFSGNTKKEFGINSHGYKYYTQYLKDADRTRVLAGAPYWVLLSKTILAGSRSKDKSGHASLVNKHRSIGYRMPHALEVATSLLSHYARSGGARLYANENSKNYWTYTRCVEENTRCEYVNSIFVGGFEPASLGVCYDLDYGDPRPCGVLGCRKFS